MRLGVVYGRVCARRLRRKLSPGGTDSSYRTHGGKQLKPMSSRSRFRHVSDLVPHGGPDDEAGLLTAKVHDHFLDRLAVLLERFEPSGFDLEHHRPVGKFARLEVPAGVYVSFSDRFRGAPPLRRSRCYGKAAA